VLSNGVEANHELAEPASKDTDTVSVLSVAVDINQVVEQDALFRLALLDKSFVNCGLQTCNFLSSALGSPVNPSAFFVF
jgi:hypothetical protein